MLGRKSVVAGLFIWAMSSAGMSLAQTEGDATPAPEAEAATTEAAETPDQEAENKEEIMAVHGDWQVRCRTDDSNCFMYQLARDSRDAPVAEVSIQPVKQDDGVVAGITVITPLRSFLPKGLTVQIDSSKQDQYPYLWCATVGCFVQYGLNEAGLNRYKRGGKARLTVFPSEARNVPVILDVSLIGFTAAFNDVAAR